MGFKPPLNDGTEARTTSSTSTSPTSATRATTATARRSAGSADGWAASGYCVLDDDYARSEFGPTNTPRENLQVTAAHEFFHAVQFAYDAPRTAGSWRARPRGWRTRSTTASTTTTSTSTAARSATRAARSTTRRPSASTAAGSGGATSARPPARPRPRIWNRADDSDNPAGNRYSMQARRQELQSRATSLDEPFATSARSTGPRRAYYEEGAYYPRPSAADSFTLSSGRRPPATQTVTIDHMANATIAVGPGSRPQRHRLAAQGQRRRSAEQPHRRSPGHVLRHRRLTPVQSKVVKLNKNGVGSDEGRLRQRGRRRAST